jgi:hypothetical protein
MGISPGLMLFGNSAVRLIRINEGSAQGDDNSTLVTDLE